MPRAAPIRLRRSRVSGVTRIVAVAAMIKSYTNRIRDGRHAPVPARQRSGSVQRLDGAQRILDLEPALTNEANANEDIVLFGARCHNGCLDLCPASREDYGDPRAYLRRFVHPCISYLTVTARTTLSDETVRVFTGR